jgi:hypothetical protein
VLIGRGIEATHCVIHYEGGHVNLVPHANAACYVNNSLIRESTKLTQGMTHLFYCSLLATRLRHSEVFLDIILLAFETQFSIFNKFIGIVSPVTLVYSLTMFFCVTLSHSRNGISQTYYLLS